MLGIMNWLEDYWVHIVVGIVLALILAFSVSRMYRHIQAGMAWEADFLQRTQLAFNKLQSDGYAVIRERTSTGEYQVVIVRALYAQDGSVSYRIIPINPAP